MKETKIDQAKTIMDDLRIQTENQKFHHGGYDLSFTISIGLSQWHNESDDFESLFIKAGKALYRAKKNRQK